MLSWTDAAVPDQTGKTAVVTAGTASDLSVAEILAHRGARVLVLADPAHAESAIARVSAAASAKRPILVPFQPLDIESVFDAADVIRDATSDRVDLLITDAPQFAVPQAYSANGVDVQWAANVISPTVLAWLLLPAIEETAGSRVVTIGSRAHLGGTLDADRIDADIQGDSYSSVPVYCRTRLAGLLASRELERHFRRSGVASVSVAADPGRSLDELAASLVLGRTGARRAPSLFGINRRPPADATRPVLTAATAPGIAGASYLRHKRRFSSDQAERSADARSDSLGALVVRIVEELSGVEAPSVAPVVPAA